MIQLENYNKVLEEIYTYFGYEEKWRVFPIDDSRDYFWKLDDHEVTFYDSKEAYEQCDDSHTYSNEFFYHGNQQKNLYEGKDYTMIVVDTRTDGNIFLQIFDNSKKL